MSRTLRRVIATSLAAGVIAAVPAAAHATLTDRTRAERAASYLASRQKADGSIPAFSPIGSTADAVNAFVAAGVGRGAMSDALDYLRRQTAAGNVDAIGLRAKVVLAVTAAGRDPRRFGGANLLAQIRVTRGSDGHFGNAAVFDDALAVLAIESAGGKPAPIALTWLLDAQCPDGGWSYDAPYASGTDDAHCSDGTPGDFFTSDSNTTSYAVQALAEAGATGWAHSPFAFFSTVRDGVKGGWAYSTGFIATDANSTALVLQAYVSAARTIPVGGLPALRALQFPRCGAFAYSYSGNTKGDPDVGATIGAVPGLLRKPFPLSGAVAGGLPAITAC